jgi:hypothetical protein
MQSLLATWKPRSKGIRWIRASGSALLVQIMLSSEAEPDFEVRTGYDAGQCHRLSGRLHGSGASKMAADATKPFRAQTDSGATVVQPSFEDGDAERKSWPSFRNRSILFRLMWQAKQCARLLRGFTAASVIGRFKTSHRWALQNQPVISDPSTTPGVNLAGLFSLPNSSASVGGYLHIR